MGSYFSSVCRAIDGETVSGNLILTRFIFTEVVVILSGENL